MEQYIVDRIEKSMAVLEYNNTYINIDISLLPSEIKEGSVLLKSDDGRFTVDEQATLKRKRALFALQNNLFNDN